MSIQQQTLTKEVLEAYRSRWDAVAQIEAEEQQRSTLAQRLQQLNMLFQFAVALHIYEKAIEQNRVEAESVRKRWLHLKGRIV